MNRPTLLIVVGAIVAAIMTILLVNRFAGGVRNIAPVTIRANQVLQQDVAFPAVTADGKKLLYYGVGQGNRTGIVRVDLATGNQELFRPLPAVSAIEWSPDRSRAILSLLYNEEAIRATDSRFLANNLFPGAITVWLYDIQQDRLEQLPQNISSATWSPNGSQILYHYFDLSGVEPISELSVREPFSSSHEKLVDIPPAPSYTLTFLDASTVMAVPNLSDPLGTSTIYFVDMASKTLTSREEDSVSSAVAAPDGRHILIASVGEKPNWRLFDRTTNSQRDLKLDAAGQYGEWIDSESLVIIEPREESDRMWIIDTASFTRQEVFIDGAGIIASAPQAVGNTLYFVSGGKLFRIALP